jgi:hypothetical protein
MVNHWIGRTRGPLRLVTSTAPAESRAPLTSQETEASLEVAALLRRHAVRLPEDSTLRAELLDAAEYYELGAEGT